MSRNKRNIKTNKIYCDIILTRYIDGECVIIESADNYSNVLGLIERRLAECEQRIIYKHERYNLPEGIAVTNKEGDFTEYINSIESEIECESEQERERKIKSVIKIL